MKFSGSDNGGLSFSVYNLLSQTLSLSPSILGAQYGGLVRDWCVS